VLEGRNLSVPKLHVVAIHHLLGSLLGGVTVIPRFMRAIRRGYATARTSNGRTYPNRGLCHAAEACSGPALCSDEHRTWQVYHAQSRFSLRCVPHADSGQPRAAGFELAGFLGRVRRLLPRCFGLLTALLDRPQPVSLVLIGIVSGWRRDRLRALFAEVIEATAH
jgi:hypothetical protein